jgi:hypothetical protein
MTSFTTARFHGWTGAAGKFLLSDEQEKYLREFPTVDDAINWLFLNGYKEDARAFNRQKEVK